MRGLAAWIAACSALLYADAAPAWIDAGITLSPGDAVTITIDQASGGIAETFRSHAADRPPTMLEATAVAAMLGTLSPGETLSQRDGVADSLPLPADAVRLTLKPVRDGRDMLLIVENGYARRLTYRASLKIAGRDRQATSVCDVPAGKTGFEHWPYRFAALTVSQPMLAAESDIAVQCR